MASERRRKRSRYGGHGGDGHDGELAHDESNWLVSYADMMTLLFGFFVLMYAFSKIDHNKFEVVRKDIAKYFGGQIKSNPAVKKAEAKIKEILAGANLQQQVKVVSRDDEVELRFQSAVLFQLGSAELTPDARNLLDRVVKIVKTDLKVDQIRVEGHTDDIPIYSLIYPTNWELSASRASRVVRQFEENGFASSSLIAQGFGSSRPLKPNRDTAGKPLPENQSANRRVVVKLSFENDPAAAMAALQKQEFVIPGQTQVDPNNPNPEAPLAQDPTTAGAPEANALTTQAGAPPPLDAKLAAAQDRLRAAQDRLRQTQARMLEVQELAEMERRIREIEEQAKEAEVRLKTTLQKGPAVRKPAQSRTPKRSKRPSRRRRAQ